MVDHTKPGGVKDLALNVLKTHHADEHVKALDKEASGSTGSPMMSSSVLQPMAATRLWTRSFARLISAHRSRSTRARLRLRRASWLLGRPSPSM